MSGPLECVAVSSTVAAVRDVQRFFVYAVLFTVNDPPYKAVNSRLEVMLYYGITRAQEGIHGGGTWGARAPSGVQYTVRHIHFVHIKVSRHFVNRLNRKYELFAQIHRTQQQ